MKTTLRWALAMAMGGILGAGPAKAATNYVTNAGFENGMSGWTELYGVPGVLSTQHHAGVYSASKYVAFVSQDYWSQVFQVIPLAAGQPVSAKLYAKSTFLPEARANGGILLQFLDKVYVAPPLPTTLSNPRFENGLHDWLDLYGAPTILSKTVFRTGKFSAQKKVDSTTSRDVWSQIYQDLACTPGRKVTVNVYAKTVMSPAALASAGVMVEAFNSAGTKLAEYTSTTIAGNTGWTSLPVVINPTPAGTAKIRISGFLWAAKGDVNSVGASAYFDDATSSIGTP